MSAEIQAETGACCDSYGPGHQLHWTQWKAAANAPVVPVSKVALDGTSIELLLAGEADPVRWGHHDPARLEAALRADSRIVASTQMRALRVDGYWFNCAPEGADLELCG